MMQVEVSKIVSAGNVRVDENDVTDLAASIDRIGLIQPLVVTQNGDDGTITLVDGHRRLAAAQSLGLKTVEVVENHTVSDVPDRLAAQYAANVYRKDLSAYEQAQVALDLKAEGLKQEDVAKELGVSKQTVSKMQKAAKIVGALPNAAEASLLDSDALFELADADIAEGEENDLIRENALRAIVHGEARTVNGALGAAEREAREAMTLEFLQPIYDSLVDRGIRFLTDDETRSRTTCENLIQHADQSRLTGNLGFSEKQVNEHRKLDCHAAHMGRSYSGPVLTEMCMKPASHREKGKSQIKEASAAEKEVTRQEVKEQRKADRDEKQLRRDQVKDFLAGKWTIKQAVEIMHETIRLPADAQRVMAKALELELDSSKYGNYPDYYKGIEEWISTLPVSKQPYASVLLLAGYAYVELPYKRDEYEPLFGGDG